ncbi:MAG: hypothetical protein IJQ22_06810 [Bacteroidales bacterium]|nr:hypothetical protein [Bacteroidales bacterium]
MKRIILFAVATLLLIPAAGAQTRQKLDKKNLVIKEYNTSAGSNKSLLDHVTTYNADGKKIEEIEYSGSSQKWRKRFEYDANGKLYRELVYDENNRLAGYKKFEYNELGKRKTQFTYNAKGKLQTVKTYTYITQDA